jgi:hypothetical protein
MIDTSSFTLPFSLKTHHFFFFWGFVHAKQATYYKAIPLTLKFKPALGSRKKPSLLDYYI